MAQALDKVVRRLALEVDPQQARLYVLADELDVHIRTIGKWLEQGRVTPVRARDINRRFGDALAPLKVLTGGKS